MSFHDTELNVIRHAEANHKLSGRPYLQAADALEAVQRLCDDIAMPKPMEAITEQLGRAAIDLIILCAMLDIDLSKCLAQAFEKISARPLPSNVVQLKKD